MILAITSPWEKINKRKTSKQLVVPYGAHQKT